MHPFNFTLEQTLDTITLNGEIMNVRSLIVEFIGTMFLVLVIGLTVIDPWDVTLAPIAIASVLMVMIYAGGAISGAHYNPAVTLAVWMRGKCAAGDVVPYMLAQVAGALVAGMAVNFFKAGAVIVPASPDAGKALLFEMLFTFALTYVVLHVATSKKTSGNSYFGLAIAFTVLAGVYAGHGISGGVLNPAVAIGVTTMGLSAMGNIWIFLVGNFLGAALAAIVYKMVNPDEFSK